MKQTMKKIEIEIVSNDFTTATESQMESIIDELSSMVLELIEKRNWLAFSTTKIVEVPDGETEKS